LNLITLYADFLIQLAKQCLLLLLLALQLLLVLMLFPRNTCKLLMLATHHDCQLIELGQLTLQALRQRLLRLRQIAVIRKLTTCRVGILLVQQQAPSFNLARLVTCAQQSHQALTTTGNAGLRRRHGRFQLGQFFCGSRTLVIQVGQRAIRFGNGQLGFFQRIRSLRLLIFIGCELFFELFNLTVHRFELSRSLLWMCRRSLRHQGASCGQPCNLP